MFADMKTIYDFYYPKIQYCILHIINHNIMNIWQFVHLSSARPSTYSRRFD